MFWDDENQLIQDLQSSKSILEQNPDLASMPWQDVSAAVKDDGTEKMRRICWAVAACLLVNSIKDFSLPGLAAYLATINGGTLTYVYAGYLLMAEHGVALDALVIEAQKQGAFEKVAPYINSCLCHQKEFHPNYVEPVLVAIAPHRSTSQYIGFLRTYSKHIVNCDAQGVVESMFGDLQTDVQYDLMRELRWDWFCKDQGLASEATDRLLKRQSIWSKKAALDFLETSLHYGTGVFTKHFNTVETLIAENNECWLMIIPLLITYEEKLFAAGDTESVQYQSVWSYLKKLPNDTVHEKAAFFNNLVAYKRLSEPMETLMLDVLRSAIERDGEILTQLDFYLYRQLEEGRIEMVLQALKTTFTAGKYGFDYHSFFERMDCTISHLGKHYAAETTEEALESILLGGIQSMFFGVGLFTSAGNIQSVQGRYLTDDQIIRVMKAILYLSFNAKEICETAFQLLRLSDGPCDGYLSFCTSTVFRNYPGTMYDVSKNYCNEDATKTELAARIIEAHQQKSEEMERSRQIKDIRPSEEDLRIAQRTAMEMQRNISMRADQASVLSQLATKRILKYGKRLATMIKNLDGSKAYSVSEFTRIAQSVELPKCYVEAPVDYALERERFLKEVERDAADH